VTYEAPVSQVERVTCSTKELFGHVSRWSEDASPTILHLQGEKADNLYLIAGNSAPIIEKISWSGDEVHFSICDASFPTFLPLPEYRITRYISDGVHDIWQEYELRFAFNLLMRMLLNRFSDLAGRILTERLCEQMSHYVTDGRMNIRITINGVANHHYYNSMEDEIHVYLEIIRRFREEAGTAIGIRMVDNLIRETLFKIDPHRRELSTRYIFDQYVPDRVTGVVWR